MHTSVITGVTGQDGAYLARQLLEQEHTVYGAFRRTSSTNLWRLEELGILNHANFKLVEFDLIDTAACLRLLEKAEPNFVYNLAAQSFVGVSFEQPIATAQMTGIGPLRLLEAIKHVNSKIRFYQASTSELYGGTGAIPQNEETPFYPRSPYAVAKLFGHFSSIYSIASLWPRCFVAGASDIGYGNYRYFQYDGFRHSQRCMKCGHRAGSSLRPWLTRPTRLLGSYLTASQ
jgi:GDPmannose 4,6-dehydratase